MQNIAKYRQGTLTGEQLEDALNESLAELLSDESLGDGEELSSSDLAGARITVREEAGIDPATILIMIGIAFLSGAASEGGKFTMRKVIARVREKHGADAIGEQVD